MLQQSGRQEIMEKRKGTIINHIKGQSVFIYWYCGNSFFWRTKRLIRTITVQNVINAAVDGKYLEFKDKSKYTFIW